LFSICGFVIFYLKRSKFSVFWEVNLSSPSQKEVRRFARFWGFCVLLLHGGHEALATTECEVLEAVKRPSCKWKGLED
jgi:hypothetical protein